MTDEPSAASRSDGGVRSARRTLEILSLLRPSRPTLTLKVVLEETGLPRTTAIRLLETLQQSGLLWATAKNTYVAGPALLRWATLAAQGWQLPEDIRAAMRQVAERTGETVSLYIRTDIHRVCIAAEESPQALRHVPHIGTEQPLWAGAPSKVLMAAAPESLLPRVAAQSPYGLDHLPTLRKWRADALRDGHSVSHNERQDGQSVASVPVVDTLGQQVAALSIAGPTARFTDDQVRLFLSEMVSLAELMRQANFENSPALHSIMHD